MLLKNLKIIGEKKSPADIEINDGIIRNIFYNEDGNGRHTKDDSITFDSAIAFPGLINSHDHLEFSLFPKLGNKVYRDYIEWGEDIHKNNNETIEKVLKVPYGVRFKYGLYKNLICGVTTVVHHGSGALFRFRDLPDIHSDYNYLHSIRLEKNWKLKLNLLFNNLPFLIHTGEGISAASAEEVNELIKWNLFGKKIIGIHGISVTEEQGRKFKALVWCPDSNLFLYGKSADIFSIRNQTNILFGTDSNVSAGWNILEHLRLARRLEQMTDEELYNSVTVVAAKVWRMNKKGAISINNTADIVAAKRKNENDLESFYSTDPSDILLITKNGKIVFIDQDLADNYPVIKKGEFDLIRINSSDKLILKGLKELTEQISGYLPGYNFPFETVG